MGDAKNEEGLWTLPVGQIQVKAHAGISILLAEHHRIEFKGHKTTHYFCEYFIKNFT
ncbi:hypothetical protein [Helicobacter sp. 13S00482-2]|uniref:hypothetical protein n=1 Tax=Helicobacter sp. 13S00482-2 TaxID=1476200 RepID=UPI001C5FD9F4|nr:hypothetical protein [Helicobacter sp. 13S00482-2]